MAGATVGAVGKDGTAAPKSVYTKLVPQPSADNLAMQDGKRQGGKTTYTYFPSGQVKTVVDPRGNVSGADPAKYT
ncbi:hypothetical protein ACFW3Y_36320, partial [Streptomyces rochei]